MPKKTETTVAGKVVAKKGVARKASVRKTMKTPPAPAKVPETVPAKKAVSDGPDSNGWIKGSPTEEGAYWFSLKVAKYNRWRVYFGVTFVVDGLPFSTLHGWGSARPHELAKAYHQPAEVPELPVAALRSARRTKKATV